MNGSTKILTVSYGTFSCTLEGFDDPLGSMRDIAEYFRDLASDDRYFGAEPPTPDVEMLQKIAEKEVQRRVDARVSDTGIALVASDAPVAAAEKAEPAPEVIDEGDDTKGPLTFDDDFLMSDEPEDVLAVDPDASADAEGPAESVAEKLRRIRAVVSKSIEVEDSESFSPEQASVADDKRDRALTETIQQITADLSDDEETPIQAEPAKADPEKIETATHAERDPAAEERAPEPVSPEATPEPVVAKENSELVAVDDAREDGTAGDKLAEEDFEDGAFDDLEELSPEPAPVAQVAEPELEAALYEETVPEQTITSHDEVEGSPDDFEEEPVEILDIDGVNRTLTDVLGRVSDQLQDDDEPNRAESEAEIPAPSGERVVSRTLEPEPETDIGRLLDETDNKLNEDDTVRRRRVISQMRAAVAATKADRLVSRQVSREVQEEAEKNQYRADLSEAVQKNPVPAPERKVSNAPPPLVLVSRQRVDPKPTPEQPSPDQVTEAKAVAPEGFAEFAASMGARELDELLEAAAAYTVFSEGQSSFTRPEIMKRVARVDPSIRMSREDSLRSFGQLLRQGKFKKLERGQFTIDEATKFNPEHRFVGE